jgi:glyoxylase-like metal-dependent hydrolase (beta-lactamase superfamily II)/rhodanese-related sulfurtransferase
MFEERYFVEGLAQASYLFGSKGEAAVVDPKRDVDDYLETAAKKHLKIVAILETHPHADFASGHVELAQRTGAKIYVSRHAAATYDHVDADESTRFRVGDLEVQVLATPGHSPDSLSFLVLENGQPKTLYTGDTLFVGDVGRPDLRDSDEKPATLADALYDSLFGKIATLPPDVVVYPSHGAGSLCGRNISSATFSTIGKERATNWALQETDRAEFVRKMLANLPSRPAYFSREVQLNLNGLPPLNQAAVPVLLTEPELARHVQAGALVIDARNAALFGRGHLPGSLNIGLDSALFSTWVGFFATQERRLILVVESDDEVPKARLELARIGFDHLIGFIPGGALKNTVSLSQLGAADLKAALSAKTAPVLVDVRTAPEWQKNHIEGARHIPLPEFTKRMGPLDEAAPTAIICGSGYRSSIAASLLQAAGFTRVQNVAGGMGAFEEAKAADFAAADLIFLGENI